MSKATILVGGWIALSILVGCQPSPTATPVSSGKPTAEGVKYVLAAEPDGGQAVAAARKDAANAEEIVVVGRIGGSTQPWSEGIAAFTIVDPALKACNQIPGDACKTPWDYCCEPNLKASTALVKFVDNGGNVVKADARTLLALKELDTVVVKGKSQRDDAGNLTILARGIYVRH
jgi:hypothetical protein